MLRLATLALLLAFGVDHGLQTDEVRAAELGALYGGLVNGAIELHRADGTWIGVAGLSKFPPPLSKNSVRVAVIDSGVLVDHPQLRGLIVGTRDFSGEGIADKVGHGTIDAILLRMAQALKEPERKDSAVEILIAKVTRMSGGKALPQRAAVIAAIKWAATHGACIVNLSLGFQDEETDNTELCGVIRSHKEILFVAAAGNSGPQIRSFPAACDSPNVLSVGVAAPWSGPGEVIAPGSVSLGAID